MDGTPISKLDSGDYSPSSGDEKAGASGYRTESPTPRWQKVLLCFNPSWFAVTQGTGIVSLILNRLPYNGDWLYWLSVIVFAVNLVLFLVFTVTMTIRFVAFPGLFRSTLRDSVQPLFFGCVPMSLATINQMICYVCFPAWGSWVGTLAWTLWWIDVVLSASCCLILPFLKMNIQEHKISTMTAVWLLPAISTIVCAAAGSTVASILANPYYSLWTILTSYVLLGMGLLLSFIILTIYYCRLVIYNIPPRESILSVFLPLGPLGQGGFTFQQLGQDALKVFPITQTLDPIAGQIFKTGGSLIALLMWGFGLVWLFFALASIPQGKFGFNMTWWSSVFPLGVFTMSTIQMGKELPSTFFKVLGTVFGVATILVWLLVVVRTLEQTINGRLFSSPPTVGYRTRTWKRERVQQSELGSESGS